MLRLEAELRSISEKMPSEVNFVELTHKAMSNLKNLAQIYREADIEGKRLIIGSTFSKKLDFSDSKGRTTYLSKSVGLMYLINNKLGNKKNRNKSKKLRLLRFGTPND